MLVYSPKKIQEIREGLGLNQSELARKARVSPPTIWYLENGETKMPKAQTLMAVARALGVPLQAILSDTQPLDALEQINSAASALEPKNKAVLLAAAQALLASQKK